MRALAWAVIVLGVALVAEGVFAIEGGWLATAGAFAIIAGAAVLIGRTEREIREESEPLPKVPGWRRVERVERDREA